MCSGGQAANSSKVVFSALNDWYNLYLTLCLAKRLKTALSIRLRYVGVYEVPDYKLLG